AEKNCVMKLRWWGEVAADIGLPEGAKVYHFHPIGLSAYFACLCTEEWRINTAFLEESEGALELNGYVPRNSAGVVIGQSGVTISAGIDLGQQSLIGTRNILNNYVAQYGNVNGVDIALLLSKIFPYFTLKKIQAVNKLSELPLIITEAQASIMAEAFKFDFRVKTANLFDAKNRLEMKYLQLPSQAQTVILDFAYQYYINDSVGPIRQRFWGGCMTGNGEYFRIGCYLVPIHT
ncbi:pesticin C-terminus-like muramidase, partial [Pseudomonas sp. CF161]|uniref:pesticin C-terminus-like muramidase n=1 Tax=Pseudomonas sp. CF161 TaxID=911241 RepID=UPI000355040C